MFNNRLNMCFQLKAYVKKIDHGVEIHRISVNKRFLKCLVKNPKLTAFWDMKGPMSINYIAKVATATVY